MMKFKQAFEKLQKSKEFIDWKKNHESSYVSYGFLMKDSKVKKEWQIGYYNPSKDTITTFSISSKITTNPESQIFKDKKKVNKLDVEKVKIDMDKALEKSKKLQKEKYPQHMPSKEIVILQNLDFGQVWNITYVTQTFKTLNIKVDSSSGQILKYELMDLFRVQT